MKEVGRAPDVHQLAVAVDSVAVGFQEVNVFGIIALEGFGYLGVGPNRVPAEHRSVLTDTGAKIFEDRPGWE